MCYTKNSSGNKGKGEIAMNAKPNQNNGYFKGVLVEPFVFAFVKPESGKRYCRGFIKILGNGGIINILPVITEEKNVKEEMKTGTAIKINGNLRTYNYKKSGQKKVEVYIFAYQIQLNRKKGIYMNRIMLEGYICKPPKSITLPTDKRILMTVLANNRGKGSTNYLPCVIYPNQLDKASRLKVGDFLQLEGRFQSRTYRKKNDLYTTYEVAVTDLKVN